MSFKEYFEIDEKLKTLEKLMCNQNQDIDLIIKKYGRLQEEYITKLS